MRRPGRDKRRNAPPRWARCHSRSLAAGANALREYRYRQRGGVRETIQRRVDRVSLPDRSHTSRTRPPAARHREPIPRSAQEPRQMPESAGNAASCCFPFRGQAGNDGREQFRGIRANADRTLSCARAAAGSEKYLAAIRPGPRSEEHTSELQSQSNLVCRLLLEKKKK